MNDINATVTGAPNAVCADLRQTLRAADLPTREASHLDAVVERLVHARAGRAETVTVTLTVTANTFTFTHATA